VTGPHTNQQTEPVMEDPTPSEANTVLDVLPEPNQHEKRELVSHIHGGPPMRARTLLLIIRRAGGPSATPEACDAIMRSLDGFFAGVGRGVKILTQHRTRGQQPCPIISDATIAQALMNTTGMRVYMAGTLRAQLAPPPKKKKKKSEIPARRKLKMRTRRLKHIRKLQKDFERTFLKINWTRAKLKAELHDEFPGAQIAHSAVHMMRTAAEHYLHTLISLAVQEMGDAGMLRIQSRHIRHVIAASRSGVVFCRVD